MNNNKPLTPSFSNSQTNSFKQVASYVSFRGGYDHKFNSFNNQQFHKYRHPMNTQPHSKFIDTIQIDYRQKTFQLMRKNTQLEVSIKQSKLDVDSLQKQVQKLSQLMVELVDVLSIRQNQSFNRQDNKVTSGKILVDNLKKILRNESLKKLQSTLQKHQNLEQEQIKSSKITYQQTPLKSNPTSVPNSHHNSQDIPIQRQQEQIQQVSCDCQQKYSEIIGQYKNIIDTQHTNIMKKDKNYKNLKKQFEQYQQITVQLKKNIQEYQNNMNDLQQQIQKLKQSQIEQTNKIKEYQQNQVKYKNKITQLQKLIAQKDKSILMLEKHIQQMFREKQKIKHKYKQQIIHFQEMEKLVQQKLIEVQYEMSFYKKQRAENFQKIRRLQTELKQFKINQQKKYYSFGDTHKDVCLQVNLTELNQNQVQNNHGQLTSKNSEILKLSQLTKHQITQPNQKQNWQIQCYEQSIKTLLSQNNRLKHALLKLYQRNNSSDPHQNIDQQTQIELKIMATTMMQQKDLKQELEQNNHDDQKKNNDQESNKNYILEEVKKGRRFIKEV